MKLAEIQLEGLKSREPCFKSLEIMNALWCLATNFYFESQINLVYYAFTLLNCGLLI